MPKKPDNILKIYRLSFDSSPIAHGLQLSVPVIEKAFQDGRVSSHFSEHWGALLYSFVKHSNSNQPRSDGGLDLGKLGEMDISVKCLSSKHVKFQKSGYQGKGRKCTQQDLITSLREVDRVIVADIRHFPSVDMILLRSKWLEQKAIDQVLKPTGWTPKKFYKSIQEDYKIEIEPFSLV